MPFALRFWHYDLAGIRLTALVIYTTTLVHPPLHMAIFLEAMHQDIHMLVGSLPKLKQLLYMVIFLLTLHIIRESYRA